MLFKKLLPISAAGILAIGLSACGDSDSASNPNNTPEDPGTTPTDSIPDNPANPGDSVKTPTDSLPPVTEFTVPEEATEITPATTIPKEAGKGFLIDDFEDGDNVYTVQSQLVGNYNFDNAMAAVAVGLHFGVEPWDIKEAIEEYEPSNNRSQFKRTGRNTLYLDCYNANPSSMAAAIASFSNLASHVPHSMAIIGGMHELGDDERDEHRRVVEQLAGSGVGQVLLVGPEWNALEVPGNMQRFDDTEAVKAWLTANPVTDATILVKGSNTNRLWTLEELL